jgi:beta-lactamase superfamily II metal-dependent hydrolase
MKITFKDVGQGDSILIEWQEAGISKIGIIDCNRKFGENPVVDHIQKAGYQNIEFIVLSHPHRDHFSGMVGLLNYIDTNSILVESFGHTLHLLASDYHKYLNGVESDTISKSDLEKLFEKVDELRKRKVIKKISFIVEGTSIPLSDGISLKCLSPSISEAEIYMQSVDLQPIKNKVKASQSANHLSTIFKLVVGDKYYLLTADSEIPTFERLIEEDIHKNLYKKQLEICQLPHHGSSKNYLPSFWNFITKGDSPKAVISAGLHETYQHPHLPVLMDFHAQGYSIHSTNIVYGMVEYMDYLKGLSHISDKLDSFSEIVNCHTGGDKMFVIIED